MIAHRRRLLAGASLFFVALAAPACTKRREGDEPSSEHRASESVAITVATELVERGRIATSVVERRQPTTVLEVPGEVRSGEGDEAIVGTLVAGRVTSLAAGVGDRVSRDQVLAAVQAPEVAKLRADARRAEARLTVAARAVARLRELEGEGATSAAALEHAQAELTGARAEFEATKTQLAGLGLRLEAEKPSTGDAGALLPSHVLLRSPIDGVIAERVAVLGASVSPGETVYRVVSSASRVVLVHVPEARVEEVDLGAQVTVRGREESAGSEGACSGTAERASSLVDDARTVLVRVRLEADCALRTAGRTLTVGLTLRGDRERVPLTLVPVSAVVELRGKHVVFVQGAEPGAFRWRAVRTGATFGDRVVVEDGLREGDRVVVRGTVLLKGEIVRAEPIE